MPLSEHEQRLFDQIEQSLAKDPKFASAVRATDPRFHTRRRIVFAVFLGIVGFALVIAGPITQAPLISVVGFVIMLGAAMFGTQTARRGVSLKAVGGTATRSTRSNRTSRTRRISFVDRLEERWRGRPEDGGR